MSNFPQPTRLTITLSDAKHTLDELIREGEESLQAPESAQAMIETIGEQQAWSKKSDQLLAQMFSDDKYVRDFRRVRTQVVPADAGIQPKYEKQADLTNQRIEKLRAMRAALEITSTARLRSPRDPYPANDDLNAIRAEIDYWVTRQGEGVPGSTWEEGVKNRLGHLRELEARVPQLAQERTSPSLRFPFVLHSTFDDYNITSQIGAGGSGTVYEGTSSNGVTYAIKILKPGAATVKKKRFQNEISFCMKGAHKNIVSVIDHGLTAGDSPTPFYVMPRYPETLRDRMKAGIAYNQILPLFSGILDGVEAAHLKGVFHRDLKPENILVDPPSGTLVVADFGIAHFEEEDLLTAVETQNRERLASFVYSAPEQRVRGNEVTIKSDIFALGLILNEMFTGEVPQPPHSEFVH